MSRATATVLGLLAGADALIPTAGLLRSRNMPVMTSSTDLPDLASLDLPGGGGTPPPSSFDVRQMAGVSAPLGFFDPVGFTTDASEGKIRFYREVELKHARVAMLAAVGFAVGEQFHPLWGGLVDVPSYIAFQETPLQTFWPAVVLAISIAEVFSVFSFQSPFGGELWAIRTDYAPGDLGFDPLGLKPPTAEGLKGMQTRELNNGRLAMIAVSGMVVQELITGQKLF